MTVQESLSKDPRAWNEIASIMEPRFMLAFIIIKSPVCVDDPLEQHSFLLRAIVRSRGI
jgi:hypothetical protein